MKIVEGNVPVAVAAAILGISEASVKGGLLAGALPIGSSWKNSKDGLESAQNMYHISPQRLAEYEGYSKQEILDAIEQHGRRRKGTG